MSPVHVVAARLVCRIAREADAMLEETSVPAAEVAALLRLLETQARGVLRACAGEVRPRTSSSRAVRP